MENNDLNIFLVDSVDSQKSVVNIIENDGPLGRVVTSRSKVPTFSLMRNFSSAVCGSFVSIICYFLKIKKPSGVNNVDLFIN